MLNPLPHDSTLALLDLRRKPGHIELMWFQSKGTLTPVLSSDGRAGKSPAGALVEIGLLASVFL